MHTLNATDLAGLASNLDSAAALTHQAIDRIDDVAVQALLRRVVETIEEGADEINGLAESLAPRRSRLHPDDRRWIETAAGMLR